jgi:hypothetical protein
MSVNDDSHLAARNQLRARRFEFLGAYWHVFGPLPLWSERMNQPILSVNSKL